VVLLFEVLPQAERAGWLATSVTGSAFIAVASLSHVLTRKARRMLSISDRPRAVRYAPCAVASFFEIVRQWTVGCNLDENRSSIIERNTGSHVCVQLLLDSCFVTLALAR
jgi:hypothetical protein